MTGTALLTDHYELTMLRAALADGSGHRPCVFEVFARHLPPGRRYGVVAGTGRLLDAVEAFRFGDDEIEHLLAAGVVDAATAAWLSSYEFSGDMDGHAEGETWFPQTPVLTVRGSFAECVLLETLVLSVLNHDCAVAAAAARMVVAAAGRPCVEMGGRRTHEWAAVAAARAAYVAGFAATSNLEAGRRHGIPTSGTSAHAFTLLHDDERSAFAAQVAALGPATTLLVDTYDVAAGVRTAIEVAGTGLGAVRLDSGDLAELAVEVRAQLDGLGARSTRIVVTSDLDERSIAALQSAPVDAYGVGTAVVTGSGAPTAGFVYKSVEVAGRPVAKASAGKSSRGGATTPLRRSDAAGTVTADVLRPAGRHEPALRERPLHVPLLRAGRRAADDTLAEARARCAASRSALPREALLLSRGEPGVATVLEGWPA